MTLSKGGNNFTLLRKLAALSLALSLQLSELPVQVFAAEAAAVASAPAARITLDRLAAIADGVALEKEEISPVTDILSGASENRLSAENFFQDHVDGKIRVSQQGRELLLDLLRDHSAGTQTPDGEEAPQSRSEGILDKLAAKLGVLTPENLDKTFDNSEVQADSPEAVVAYQNGSAGSQPEGRTRRGLNKGHAILPAAVLMPYAGQASGVATWTHEQSHIEAAKALYNPEQIGIQIDAFENIKNFFSNPSWENLKRVLIRYDVDQNGFGGYMWTDKNRTTKLGTMLGQQRSDLIVNASGSIGQDLPALGGYAAGFAIRKKNPLGGYTLMLTSAIHHLMTALYPWQAAVLPARGGDWVRIAGQTGIHPAVTALAFTAILPVEALALARIERMMENSRDNKLALYNIVKKGILDDAALRSIYDSYSRREELSLPDGLNISDLLKLPPEQVIPKAKGKLVKEIKRFQSHVIGQNKKLIEAERKLLPKLDKSAICRMKEYFNEKHKTDKIGAGLEAGTMAASLATGLAGLASVADWAGQAAAGSAMKSLVPALGLFTIASSGNSIRRILQDKTLDKTQKILRVSQHIGGIVASGSLLNPAAAPVLLPAGLATALTALAAEWVYNRHKAK